MTQSSSEAFVTFETVDGIGFVTFASPPVNALGAGQRRQLLAAFERAEHDSGVEAMCMRSSGKLFIGGADIREFDSQPVPPSVPELIAFVEGMRKPTAAAIRGACFGGGLELAMAFRLRVARADALLAQPEINLGLIPGAGGTLRLPRLVGPELALEMIISGEPISAEAALKAGLVDLVCPDKEDKAAAAHLKSLLQTGAIPPLARDRTEKLKTVDVASIRARGAELSRRRRGEKAPSIAIEAICAGLEQPFEAALAKEREAFLALRGGDESAAMRHIFFAERSAAKSSGNGTAAPVSTVGVVGGGTMGSGIAMAVADSGFPVVLVERSPEAAEQAISRIETAYQKSAAKNMGRTTTARQLIRHSDNLAELSGCDLIIEAAYEDMEVKQQIFRKLDEIADRASVLATNTSYLDVNAIAAATSQSEKVLGMHFFSPAQVMKLLEVVVAEKTSADTVATVMRFGKSIGKIAVPVGVCDGFVGNRMLTARNAETTQLLLEGALPEQVDEAFRNFGWPMGPFQMSDMAGLDISWRYRKARGRTLAIADALCELGRFGQKTGSGYYRYESGSRIPVPDPEVTTLIVAEAERRGIVRRDMTEQEIIERTMLPLVNEGAKILSEGIARSQSDIDVIWVNGYGFPRRKGGPMYWARSVKGLQDRLAYWYEKTGREGFRPASNIGDLSSAIHPA